LTITIGNRIMDGKTDMLEASLDMFCPFQQKLSQVLDGIIRTVVNNLLQAFLYVDLQLLLNERSDAHLLHLHSLTLLLPLASRAITLRPPLVLLYLFLLLLSLLHP
jgi:hypothetical protein